MIWWAGDADAPGRVVMTDLPANGVPFKRGRRRMWIETLCRAWQSSGLHLDQTASAAADRVHRLLIGLSMADVLFLSLGRWVVKRSYRRLIEDGEPRAWHSSLFQRGVGWMIFGSVMGALCPLAGRYIPNSVSQSDTR